MQVGFVMAVFGPILPPAMQWDRAISVIIPTLLARECPKPTLAISLSRPKRSAWTAFEVEDLRFYFDPVNPVRVVDRRTVPPVCKPVLRALRFHDGDDADDEVAAAIPMVFSTPSSAVNKYNTRARKKITPMVESIVGGPPGSVQKLMVFGPLQ